MNPAAIAGITIAALTGLGIAVMLIVLIARGGFIMGQLSNQVEAQAKAIDALTASVNDLRAEVQQSNQALRAEIQQSNQMLAALANHTHDTDGRTVFQVPPSVSR